MAYRKSAGAEISDIVTRQEARWADDGVSEGSMDSLDRRILRIPSKSNTPENHHPIPQPRERVMFVPARRPLNRPIKPLGTSKPLPGPGEPGYTMTTRQRIALEIAKRDALYASLQECEGRHSTPTPTEEEPYAPVPKHNDGASEEDPKFENIKRRMREGLAAIKNKNHKVEQLSDARSPSPVKRQRYTLPPLAQRRQDENDDDEGELETMEDIKRSLTRRRAIMDVQAARSLSPSPIKPKGRPHPSGCTRAEGQEERKESPVGHKELRALSRLLNKRPPPDTAKWEAMLDRTSRSTDSVPQGSAATDLADLQRDLAPEHKQAKTLQESPINTHTEESVVKDEKKVQERDTDAYDEPTAVKEEEMLQERDINTFNRYEELNTIKGEVAEVPKRVQELVPRDKHIPTVLMDKIRRTSRARSLKRHGGHGTPRRKSAVRVLTFKAEDDAVVEEADKDGTMDQTLENFAAERETNQKNTDFPEADVGLEDTITDQTLENFAVTRENKPAISETTITEAPTTTATSKPTTSGHGTLRLATSSDYINLQIHMPSIPHLWRHDPTRRLGISLTWLGTFLLSLLLWYFIEDGLHTIIGKPKFAYSGQDWNEKGPIWGDAIPTVLEKGIGWPIGWLARLPKNLVVMWPSMVKEALYEWAVRNGFSDMEREAMRLGVPIAALYRSEIANSSEELSMDQDIRVIE